MAKSKGATGASESAGPGRGHKAATKAAKRFSSTSAPDDRELRKAIRQHGKDHMVTTRDAARLYPTRRNQHGVSDRYIVKLANEGRIPGARRMPLGWLIPIGEIGNIELSKVGRPRRDQAGDQPEGGPLASSEKPGPKSQAVQPPVRIKRGAITSKKSAEGIRRRKP
jgi:hypothetical protein